MAKGSGEAMIAAVEKLGNRFQIDAGQRWELRRALRGRGDKGREELQ